MSEQDFIEKWRGEESGFWSECACALFWAKSYKMHQLRLAEMSTDYLSVDIEHRAPCSQQLAYQSIQ